MNFILKTLITAVFFVGLLYIFPQRFDIGNVSTLFTAVALLFGVIAGFFIAATLTNYFKLQSLVAKETSKLIALHENILVLEPSLKKQINEAIDNYLIAAFDWEFSIYIDKTWDEFDEIIKITKKVKERDSELYSQLLNIRDDLIETRQEMTLTGRRIIGLSHWVTLIVLASTSIFLLYVMKEPSLESSIFTVLLSSTTCLVLFLLQEIDNNTFAEEQLAFSVYQIIFKRLGNLPYFSELDLKEKRVKIPKSGKYRVGIYKNYPKSVEKDIKIIGH